MCGACWLACSDCGAGVGGGAEIVYNLYTFFGVGVGWLYLCIRKLMRALPCLVSRLIYIIRCMCGALVMTKLFY